MLARLVVGLSTALQFAALLVMQILVEVLLTACPTLKREDCFRVEQAVPYQRRYLMQRFVLVDARYVHVRMEVRVVVLLVLDASANCDRETHDTSGGKHVVPEPSLTTEIG